MPLLKIVLLIVVFNGIFSIPGFAQTTNELISRADAAASQKKYRSALIDLKNASKQDPDNVEVRLKIIQLFVETGQGLQAEVELDKAQRLGARAADTAVFSAKAKLLLGNFDELTEDIDLLDLPQTEIARLRAIQGHAFFEQRKFPQASRMFRRALLLSPTELEVELGQAKLFQLDGNRQKENQLILSLLKRHPHKADVLIVAGNFYRRDLQFERALELFERAGEIQPSNVNVWFGVVRSQIGKRNFNGAKIEIEKVLNSYPEHQVGNYLLSVIAFEQGDYNRARAAIDIVLKGEKRNFEALKLLSIIQFQQKKYTGAEKNLTKYLKSNPDDVEAKKTLAAIYLKRKQGVLALRVLNQLEGLDNVHIYSMIATAYLQVGNPDKAEQYMQKSMQAAPDDLVMQRHFQHSKLAAGITLAVEFSDTNFNNFLTEGHIVILDLLLQRKYSKATEIIQGYMKKMPDNALLHYLQGSTDLYQSNIDNASKNFQRSLELNSNLIESRINLAKIHLMKGNERDAEREFREVLRHNETNDQAFVALAGIFHRAGNNEDMLKWLNKSRKVNSASLASREVLEDYYRRNGLRKKALEISQEMISIQPHNVSLLLKHANNQKALKRLDLAIKTFKKIVEYKPELTSAWSGLGRLQFLDEVFEDAQTSYKKVLDLDPDNLIAKIILIQIDLKTKRFDSALAQATRLKREHPDSPAGFDMSGDVYIALGQPQNAILDYQQSVNLKYSSDTYSKLHSAYNRNHQVTKGFELLQQWVKANPEDYILKEILALTYQRRGEFEKSSHLYQEIIKKVRKNDRVLNNLALVSLELKNPMSIEYAELAYNLNPANFKNKDTLGWVLLNNHNPVKAVSLLKEATEAAPSDPDIRYHYAVALHQTGDRKQALKHLYLAIGSGENFRNKAEAEKLINQLKSN